MHGGFFLKSQNARRLFDEEMRCDRSYLITSLCLRDRLLSVVPRFCHESVGSQKRNSVAVVGCAPTLIFVMSTFELRVLAIGSVHLPCYCHTTDHSKSRRTSNHIASFLEATSRQMSKSQCSVIIFMRICCSGCADLNSIVS